MTVTHLKDHKVGYPVSLCVHFVFFFFLNTGYIVESKCTTINN